MQNLQKSISGLFVAQKQDVHELNTLHAATVALLNTMELDLLWNKVLTVALDTIPSAEKGLLAVADPLSGEMQIRTVEGDFTQTYQPGSLLALDGEMSRGIKERAPALLANGSSLIAPLLLGDQLLGILMLTSAQRQGFMEIDLRLAAAFAATASVAIRNAQLYAEVQRRAVTDHLTGLFNRRGFFDLGQRELERTRRLRHHLSAVVLDLDHLAAINEAYGRGVGDQVICGVAERCRKNIRHIDLLARYGGEEFAALLPETDLAMLYQVAERLRSRVAEAPIQTQAGPIPVTISLGVTLLTSETLDLTDLLGRADTAMYVAKRMGGNHLIMR